MNPNTVQVREYPSAIASGVTVSELRVHLGLFEDDSQDAYLTELILSAEQAAGNFIGYSIGETQKTALWANFYGALTIPDKYLVGGIAVTFTYVNESSVTTTISSSLYTLDTTGETPVIRLNTGQSYPTDINQVIANPVSIQYTTGFDSDELSSALNQAILMYCYEQYAHRGLSSDRSVNTLPLPAERLLAGYRKVVV